MTTAVEKKVEAQAPVTAPRDVTLMRAGGLLLAAARRNRDEVEDLVLIQEIKDSGEYRQIVEEHGAEGEPWEAFCRLIGRDRKTLNGQLAAVRQLGPGTMTLARKAGLPDVGLRALLSSPDEVQAELRKSGGAMTPEDLRALADSLRAAHERADRERERAEAARHEADDLKTRLERRNNTLAKMTEDLRDAQAELKLLKDGTRVTELAEVEKRLTVVKRALDQAQNALGQIDWTVHPRAASVVLGEVVKFAGALREMEAALREEALAER